MKLQKKRLKKQSENNQKTFLEHLQELRYRFFIWFSVFMLGSLAGYFLYTPILSVLTKPLNKPLYYTSPIGGFETILTISLFFGFLISIPVFIYQVIKFIEPGFGNRSIKSFIWSAVLSFLLSIVGVSVSYFFVLPAALTFLSKFGGSELTPLISTKDYFSFVTKYLTGFAILFQLPLVMHLINKYKKLNVKNLLSNFKYVFLSSFVIAAILTPTPDLVNQSMMALPIILLYLLSVGTIALTNRLY